MKSERRHELQHNELADALGSVTERIRPYLRLLGGIAVAGLLALLVTTYISGQNTKRVAAGWDEYYDALNAGDRERLSQIAEKYADTVVAPWARVTAADIALGEGCTRLFRERSLAKESLQQAASNYQTVLDGTAEPALRQRALFGLARSYEALDQLPKARETYRKLIDTFPEGVYLVAAKSRLADINRDSTKQFYDWFAKYEPPAAVSPTGKRPDFLEDSLDDMNLKLPSSLDEPLDKSPEKTSSGLDELDLPELPDKTDAAAPSAEVEQAAQEMPAEEAEVKNAAETDEPAAEPDDAEPASP